MGLAASMEVEREGAIFSRVIFDGSQGFIPVAEKAERIFEAVIEPACAIAYISKKSLFDKVPSILLRQNSSTAVPNIFLFREKHTTSRG